MNATELKKLFNLLYNNINNNAAPGLSDAEIEMFLNKALDEIVKQHVLGVHTNYQLGVNQTSKRDVELDTLIKTCTYIHHAGDGVYHPKGLLYDMEDAPDSNPSAPPNILMILSEMVYLNEEDDKIEVLDVVELNYQQLSRFLAGVYKYPKKNQCWKIRHDSLAELVFPTYVYNNIQAVIDDLNPAPTFDEVIADYVSYISLYVEMPPKIDITSATDPAGCSLPEVLHIEIVLRAVELAKAAYASQDTNIQLSMGQRSE